MAEAMEGHSGRTAPALPLDPVRQIVTRYGTRAPDLGASTADKKRSDA
jgi:hypothetical protein